MTFMESLNSAFSNSLTNYGKWEDDMDAALRQHTGGPGYEDLPTDNSDDPFTLWVDGFTPEMAAQQIIAENNIQKGK